MTYLKKIIFAASLAVASLGFSLSANAVLITHDLLLDGTVIGEFSVSLLENGAQSTAPGGIEFLDEFESFSINGISVIDVFQFFAEVDANDIFAGVQVLFFEAESIIPQDIGVLGVYFVGDPTSFYYSYDLVSFVDIDLGILSLSTARVVSEPSVLALFALALVGFGVRRKAK